MRSEDLTGAERLVWEAFPHGERVDLRPEDPALDDPAGGADWGADRTVRGEVIRAILLGDRKAEPGAVASVRVVGARIAGCLDLGDAELPCPVYLERCWFEESPALRGGVARYLNLGGSCLPGLMADDLRVDGSLVLTGCRFDGTTRPRSAAHAAGNACPPGRAVSATGITVNGGVFMNGGFTADGEIRLLAGHIAGVLDLGGAQLRNPDGVALLAARIFVDGPVFCREGFAAEGEVVFRRAHITGSLDLSGARLSNPAGRAFFAPALTVDEDVFCRDGSVFNGEINIVDGHIAGLLDLSGAQLDNPGGTAIMASRLTVGGPVFGRDGFTAKGEVILRRAHITGFLSLESARLSNPTGFALFAPGLAVDGAYFRDSSIFDGQVSLEGAHITGDLDLTEARFMGHAADALACAHLSARQLKMPQEPIAGTVDLSHARIGILNAHPDSAPDGIRVSELIYDTLMPLLPPSERVRWLATIDDGYLPQPYEQLAATYRRLGHDTDARSVLLAKQRRRHRTMPLPVRLWGWLQDVTTGYGYRPGRAGLWLLGLVAVGTAIFALHHPAPARGAGNPQFNPFFYTLDLLLPVVSYGQQITFQPTGPYQWLSYGLITAGWILATTIVAGITRALYRG